MLLVAAGLFFQRLGGNQDTTFWWQQNAKGKFRSLLVFYDNLNYKVMSLWCLGVGCVMAAGLERAVDWGSASLVVEPQIHGGSTKFKKSDKKIQ